MFVIDNISNFITVKHFDNWFKSVKQYKTLCSNNIFQDCFPVPVGAQQLLKSCKSAKTTCYKVSEFLIQKRCFKYLLCNQVCD